MTKEQENRILTNQGMIMAALVTLLGSGGGRDFMADELRRRVQDIKTFTDAQRRATRP
jgi:ribose 1,5-bisphosphokinase PhnN